MKCILMFGCYILIIIKWALWIPYFLLIFPLTERFMHEYDIFMYPTYWLDDLKTKNIK